MLSINWVDLIIVLIIAVYSYQGVRRGFFATFAETVSFTLSFVAGIKFYPAVSDLILEHSSLPIMLTRPLGFIAIAILSQIVIASTFSLIYKHLPDKLFRSRINHVFGMIPGIFDSLILAAFILTLITVLPLPQQVGSQISSSRIGSKLTVSFATVENNLNSIFGTPIENGINFLTIRPSSNEAVDLHFKTNSFTIDQTSEEQMLQMVNEQRKKHTLKALELNTKLRKVARNHSQDMVKRGYFSHIDQQGKDPFDRMRTNGITYQMAGENLAYAPSVQVAQQGLMNSQKHRDNILNPDFKQIGIGILDIGNFGKMFTQEFTD